MFAMHETDRSRRLPRIAPFAVFAILSLAAFAFGVAALRKDETTAPMDRTRGAPGAAPEATVAVRSAAEPSKKSLSPAQPLQPPSKNDGNESNNDEFTPQMTLHDQLVRSKERAELSARFEGEGADQPWRRWTVDTMSTLLLRNGFDADQLQNVDCRRTICRFEVAARSSKELDMLRLIHVVRELTPETWLLSEKLEDDSWKIDVFFARDGYRLSGGGGRITDAPVEGPPMTDEAQPSSESPSQ